MTPPQMTPPQMTPPQMTPPQMTPLAWGPLQLESEPHTAAPWVLAGDSTRQGAGVVSATGRLGC